MCKDPKPLAVVALLSDLHLHEKKSILSRVFNYKFERVIEDLRMPEFPNNRPDYWVINGDICDYGLEGELQAFLDIIGQKDTKIDRERLLVTTGNHEFLKEGTPAGKALLEKWQQTFGSQQLYSSRDIGGKHHPVHFVLLANEHRSDGKAPLCWITYEQIEWLRRDLEENKHKDTVVFMHQPLTNTVYPAKSGSGLCVAQEQELRTILRQHPQVMLWFSGHTHCLLGPWEEWKEHGVTYVGLAATSYVPNPEHGLSEDDVNRCQYRVLEIYDHELVVRTRNLWTNPEKRLPGQDSQKTGWWMNEGEWIGDKIQVNRPHTHAMAR
jgi:hypothetical protein